MMHVQDITPLREGAVRLPDGRRLAYAESGDPTGLPVVLIHGNPGSRYMRHPDDGLTRGVGVRLIVPDRPGYGLSDFQPGRTLLDFPADIEHLADKLGIGQFAVMGVSAGGPYAAVCAWRLGGRVTRAAIVSGSAPFDRPGAAEGVNREYRTAFRMAAWPEWALQPVMMMHDRTVRADPKRAFANLFAKASPEDKRILSNPAIAAQVSGYRLEATRQGVRGMMQEARLLVSPWGFKLEQIRPEVHLWYWDGDSIVPPQMGRYLASRIPRAVPHILPGGGHFGIFSQWVEILSALVRPE